jgi:hypothetical protein
MACADQPNQWFAGTMPPGHPRGSPATGARLLRLACAAAVLSGCTTVRVSDPSGVRTTYYPGVAVVRLAAAEAMQVVEVQALGPALVGNQASLGWLHSQIALVPPDRCQLLLWNADAAAVAELRERIGPVTELCTPGGKLK